MRAKIKRFALIGKGIVPRYIFDFERVPGMELIVATRMIEMRYGPIQRWLEDVPRFIRYDIGSTLFIWEHHGWKEYRTY